MSVPTTLEPVFAGDAVRVALDSLMAVGSRFSPHVVDRRLAGWRRH